MLIHDLEPEWLDVLSKLQDDTVIFDARGKFAPCQGCFGCWLSTPGHCYIRDDLKHMGGLIGTVDQLTIVSRICYGGYSEAVKKALDRSLASTLPFFTYRDGIMCHPTRYGNHPAFKVVFYGECNENEQDIARRYVEANRNNMNATGPTVIFVMAPAEVGGVL